MICKNHREALAQARFNAVRKRRPYVVFCDEHGTWRCEPWVEGRLMRFRYEVVRVEDHNDGSEDAPALPG